MRGKILLATGLAVGYVLGTRAGRERYEQIKSVASRFWSDPRVQKQVHHAEDFVKDKAPEVAEFVADQGKKVVAQVTASKAAATETAKAPAAKTPAKRSTTTRATPAKS